MSNSLFCKLTSIMDKSMRTGARSRNFRRHGRRKCHVESGSGNGNKGAGTSEETHKQHGRHPPHLKGKEIGLWYARRGGAKKQLLGELAPPMLMSSRSEQRLQKIIDNVGLMPFSEKVLNKNESLDNLMEKSIATMSFAEPTNRYFNNKPNSKKSCSKEYLEIQNFRKTLPSYNMRHEILETIEKNTVVVISGETGCGKTTQVPQFILDHFFESGKPNSSCSIVCTQPRRISAISVAERVACERGEACGAASVGYQIRLENKLPKNRDSILFCTTGVLLKWFQSDKLLGRATHLIVDEVHERSIHSDFLLMMLKDIIKIRSDLKVILMSATINSDMFSKYFDDCPKIHIPGFTYPVQEVFLEDILDEMRYRILPPEKPKRFKWSEPKKKVENDKDIEVYYQTLQGKYPLNVIWSLRNQNEAIIDLTLVSALIKHICMNKKVGAILLFLPGWSDISTLNKMLTDQRYFNSGNHLIIPLHSLMPTANQKAVFNRPPDGVWKIILATNIAETSITIDDVVYVIDPGKIKMTNFDTNQNIATLQAEWVSQANARQRKGRAGRVQEGICYHLYTTYRSSKLDTYQLPEMLRTRLEELCLQIKLLQLGEIAPFLSKAMEPPSPEAIKLSIKFLQALNALDEKEELTPLGYHLAYLPVHPQAGKMILFGAMFSCLDPITTVAASIGFKDAFVTPLGKEELADKRRKEIAGNSNSDHIMLIKAFEGWKEAKQRGNEHQYCWNNFLSANTLQLLSKMKHQFAEFLKDLNFIHEADPKCAAANLNSHNENLIKAIICAGLYPNIAKFQSGTKRKVCSQWSPAVKSQDGERAVLFPNSVLSKDRYFQSPWIVYHEKWKSCQVYIRDATVVSPYSLLLFCGKLLGQTEKEGSTISVDGWIKYSSSRNQIQLFQLLRRQLDQVLENKINIPCPTDWNSSTPESNLLRGILELLSTEKIEDHVPNVNKLLRDPA